MPDRPCLRCAGHGRYPSIVLDALTGRELGRVVVQCRACSGSGRIRVSSVARLRAYAAVRQRAGSA